MDSELKETISLYKTACCLKNLPRQGWIQEGALAAEADSVAGHSFCVTLIAFMIAQVLKNRGMRSTLIEYWRLQLFMIFRSVQQVR